MAVSRYRQTVLVFAVALLALGSYSLRREDGPLSYTDAATLTLVVIMSLAGVAHLIRHWIEEWLE